MQTLLVFVLVTATSFSGVIGAGPAGEDLPIWARWLEPVTGQRRERVGRQGFLQIPLTGSSGDSGGLPWQQFGNQWQQPFNQWQQPFGQFGQNQFGNNQKPNEFGQNPDQTGEDQFGQNQRPNQFGQNQFGNNQRPNEFGQNPDQPNEDRYGQNQFGQNQRPNQFGQNQFGQNQQPNQFGQNQRPGQNQFGQNQRPNQSGQNQFSQNQRPNQRPSQSGQNQFGQNQRPNESGQNQFGQNQRPNQSGENQFGQNQRPNQFGQNQSGQNQRPNQRPNEQEFEESNKRPSQFGQGSQEGGEEQYVNQPLQPGESCRRDNKVGKCTRIYQCQEVVEMLQQNRRPPPPCYVPPNDSTPYVCCLDRATTSPTPTPKPKPGPVTQPSKPRPQQVTERLSKKKCKEYARYVFEKVESPALFESGPIEVDRCVKSAEGLIVGGVDAALGEFPHMALLGYGNNPDALSWECGGSLISDDYVLTAAHCVAEKTPSYILLGELVLGDDNDRAQPQLISIADRGIIPHPDYRFPSNYFDVALVRLSRRATLGPYVRPACLHTGESYTQGSLIASGWGRTDFGGDPSDSLMKVNLNEVGFEACNKTYRNMGNKLSDGIRNNQQICAGRLEGGKDTCQGDSGGPLQVFRSSPHCTYDIVGVVSFGKGCALRNTPGVYARVKFFLDWIERTVWPNASG